LKLSNLSNPTILLFQIQPRALATPEEDDTPKTEERPSLV